MKLKPESIYTTIIVSIITFNLVIFGCVPRIKKPGKDIVMEPISSWSLPEFSDDMRYSGLEHSILKSLSYLNKIPADREFVFGQDRYNTDHMIVSLQQFLDFIQTQPSRQDLNEFIQSNYRVYRSVGRDGWGEVLYTGYYEPHLRGSLIRAEEYQFPIYSKPDDLIAIDLSLFNEKYTGQKIIGRYTDQTVVPYYERSAIDSEGVLEGRAEVLAWVEDPVDIFFLQIQGSGKVYLAVNPIAVSASC
jgi:membrane-bound lytic murein transglycosylase A